MHGDDTLAAKLSVDEIALVPDSSGHREFGDISVRDHNRFLDLFGQVAEAASEYYADRGQFRPDARFEIAGRMVDSFGSFVHSVITFV